MINKKQEIEISKKSIEMAQALFKALWKEYLETLPRKQNLDAAKFYNFASSSMADLLTKYNREVENL